MTSSVRTNTTSRLYFVSLAAVIRAAMAAFVLLWLMPVFVSAQQAQDQSGASPMWNPERPVADSHSFMELFTKLETQWTQAMQKRDRSGLETLLAPEFIVRNADDPQHPLERDAWISDVLAGPEIESVNQDTMAIRAFMGVAIVSFAQKEQRRMSGKNRNVRCFVVDVWEVNHQKWQVAQRYISLVGNKPPTAHHAESPLP